MKMIKPQAKLKNIVMENLTDEVLICDLDNNKAFCLNKTAGEVWKLCDGKSDVQQIAKKIGITTSEETVLLAIEKLNTNGLLVEQIPNSMIFQGMSRREAMAKIGVSVAVILPLISVITLPEAINAASGSDDGVGGAP